jgi:hypothetical protein
MNLRILTILIFIFCLTCASRDESKDVNKNGDVLKEMAFDRVQWDLKDDKDYVYRSKMLNDIVYNDTIRNLKRDELVNLLGEPNYIKENHLYYRISEKRLGGFVLRTKTMVIKINDSLSIDWIKIHE